MADPGISVLPKPLPKGVEVEPTPRGLRVTISTDKAPIHSRSVWVPVLGTSLFVFVTFTVFFGMFGVISKAPSVLLAIFIAAILAGFTQIGGARSELAKRRSMPAKLELTKDCLMIDEPSFNYGSNGRKIVNIVPTHMEYPLTDLAGFSIRTLAGEGMLRVQLSNRLSNDHLKGRDMDQLQWACQWLSSSVHTALPGKQGPIAESFVYDKSGLHKG